MISSSSLRNFARRSLTTLAVASLPILSGGWLYGPQSTFDTKGPVAAEQLKLFYVTLWVTGIIFVIVAGVLTYTTIKFKARSAEDEHAAPPPQGHGNPLVELGLIGASVLALVFIAVPTLHAIRYTYDVPEAEKANAYDITATGLQWWFRFEYAAEQIELPNGAGKAKLTVANELVIPVGRPIRLQLRTSDVIHSFWVPKLAGKVDMMPNRANHLWLQADQPGYFWGQCAEYCGEDHAVMRFRVIALNEADFAKWLASQKQSARSVTVSGADSAKALTKTFVKKGRNAAGWTHEFDLNPMQAWEKQQTANAAEENAELIAQGRKLFETKTCMSCHTIRGTNAAGTTAPDLTHVGARTTIAGGLLENSPDNLYRWITDPNGVKPGNKMYVGVPMSKTAVMTGYKRAPEITTQPDYTKWADNITVNDDEARALVAYLHSLK